MYAEREFYKWEKTVLWDMIEPYRRPKSFTPLISIYVAAFYTGVVGAAITEQLYKVFNWTCPNLSSLSFFFKKKIIGTESFSEGTVKILIAS